MILFRIITNGEVFRIQQNVEHTVHGIIPQVFHDWKSLEVCDVDGNFVSYMDYTDLAEAKKVMGAKECKNTEWRVVPND